MSTFDASLHGCVASDGFELRWTSQPAKLQLRGQPYKRVVVPVHSVMICVQDPWMLNDGPLTEARRFLSFVVFQSKIGWDLS